MSRVKTRNFLILCHLFMASLIAPAFILVSITGFNYLIGNKGETVQTTLIVPQNVQIDPDATDIEHRVRQVLAANDLPQDFEYLRMRDGSITTRPTSRDFVQLSEEDGEWSATLEEPNLQYRMMELHKGHGPEKFKIYQMVAAAALFFIIIGGTVVGLMAKAYRTKIIGSVIVGTVVFALLAFVI